MATLQADPRIRAFLDLIALSEGTSSSPITRADGYDIIVTGIDGGNRFDDFSTHPFADHQLAIVVRDAEPPVYGRNQAGQVDPSIVLSKAKPPLKSTASGRYQITYPTWSYLYPYLDDRSFSPRAQDAAAIKLLEQCAAYVDIIQQDIPRAINRAALTWASFPGNSYSQGGHSEAKLLEWYAASIEAQKV